MTPGYLCNRESAGMAEIIAPEQAHSFRTAVEAGQIIGDFSLQSHLVVAVWTGQYGQDNGGVPHIAR